MAGEKLTKAVEAFDSAEKKLRKLRYDYDNFVLLAAEYFNGKKEFLRITYILVTKKDDTFAIEFQGQKWTGRFVGGFDSGDQPIAAIRLFTTPLHDRESPALVAQMVFDAKGRAVDIAPIDPSEPLDLNRDNHTTIEIVLMLLSQALRRQINLQDPI